MNLSRWFFLPCIFLAPLTAKAQEPVDAQVRPILHVQSDMKKDWFLAGWVIANGQYRGTNNINLFGGIGYRGQNWWIESMFQHQWSETGRKILFDNRFQLNIDRISLYVEVAPFLDRHALYDMVVLEQGIWRNLNIGVETENVHKSGRDSLGVGPRISASLGSVGGYRVASALAYRVRRQESNELRFYLVFNRRFQRSN